MNDTPNLLETVAGAFLHDIGKFLQRARGSIRNARPSVQARISDVLRSDNGNYTHKHALWTDEFFQWMDDEGLNFPAGLNRARVRDVAVYHHNPLDRPAGYICTEADRLASGMDRKTRDESQEQATGDKGWDAFIRTPLVSPFSSVDIRKQQPPPTTYSPLAELLPDSVEMPRRQIDTARYQQHYRALLDRFQTEFARLCREIQNPGLFLETLKSLSERFLYAVPSSTVDQPDISLHDHSHAAAAIAAALYRWHQSNGDLADSAAVRNRELPKFRFIAGDLSGIQSSLFLLANQHVRGASKILRARSFLLSATMDAAALLCRTLLGYPVFSVLQSAGGRFLLLVANTPDVEEKLSQARREIERWIYRRHFGEVACNIALTEPLPGKAFDRQAGLFTRAISSAIEEAKLHPFSTVKIGIHRDVAFPHGACAICGRRPAQAEDAPCAVCAEERAAGAVLPRLTHLSWHQRPAEERARAVSFFGGLTLALHESEPRRVSDALSVQRVWRGAAASAGSYPLRWLSNYVPRLSENERDARKYAALSSDAQQTRAGDVKTFEHLAWDAARESDGELLGQPMLAVLKADVDHLGAIFSFGIPDRTLGRITALSRMLDFFFTGYLSYFLENKFPNIYTVYAGGDDLLMVGPWNEIVRLAPALRDQFSAWTGGNPNVTLSAGIELMKMNHPIRRTVAAAGERLDAAKEGGRDCACLFGTVVNWSEYRSALEKAAAIGTLLEKRAVSQVFVYRLLEFDEQRRRAEGFSPLAAAAAVGPAAGRLREQALDVEAASWRARWGYHLKRNILDNKNLPAQDRDSIARLFSGLLGLDRLLNRAQDPPAPVKVAVSIALYNNRSAERS
jgi:CRISPR-associated protein Csm1